jgi:hypothetical protein
VLPIVTGLIAWRICKELSRQDAHPISHPVGGILVRTASGGYELEAVSRHGGRPDDGGDGHPDDPEGHPDDGGGHPDDAGPAPSVSGGPGPPPRSR